MVIELSSGPFLAIEIGCRTPGSSAYKKFREFCGPADPVSEFGEVVEANTLPILCCRLVFFRASRGG